MALACGHPPGTGPTFLLVKTSFNLKQHCCMHYEVEKLWGIGTLQWELQSLSSVLKCSIDVRLPQKKPRERTREEASALKEGERESGGMNRTGRHNRRHGQSLQRNWNPEPNFIFTISLDFKKKPKTTYRKFKYSQTDCKIDREESEHQAQLQTGTVFTDSFVNAATVSEWRHSTTAATSKWT